MSTGSNKQKGTAPTGMQVIIREFKRDYLAIISLITVVVIIDVVFVWALLIDQEAVMRISLHDIFSEPGNKFLLGADQGGRDVFGQLVIGARNSIAIAMAITLLAGGFGIWLGLVCGYFGGWLDNLCMRLIDFYMTVPSLMLIIVFLSIIPEYTMPVFIGIMSMFLWTGTARLVRSKVLSESRRDYINASKTLGTSDLRIMFGEILPNISSIVIVEMTLNFAGNVGIETGLSYLGFGLPPSIPSLGALVSYANNPLVLQQKWWVWLPASFLILVLMLSINYIGQALRKIADVKQRL